MSQGVTVKIRRFLVQTPKTDLGEGAGGEACAPPILLLAITSFSCNHFQTGDVNISLTFWKYHRVLLLKDISIAKKISHLLNSIFFFTL